MVVTLGLNARIQTVKGRRDENVKCSDMPYSYCGNHPESMTFGDCAADATDPIPPKAPRVLPDDPDSIAVIDEALRLTIADMPNALRLLENS